ncbi:hypothetical protein ACFQX7_22685 [Luedemannella flava]
MTANRQLLRVGAVAAALVAGLGAALVTASPAAAAKPRISVNLQVRPR